MMILKKITDLHGEGFAKVKLATNRIVEKKVFVPLALDPPFKNKIGTINNIESLSNVVIRDQNTYILGF